MRYGMLLSCKLALGAALLVGCGWFGGSVEQRAAVYYGYLAGSKPRLQYSDFLSPAYRAVFDAEALAQLNENLKVGKTAPKHAVRPRAADVGAAVEGRFAITVLDPALGSVLAGQEPVRWVKVGTTWYLYSGADAEADEYGPFPAGLEAPPPPSSETEMPELPPDAEVPAEEGQPPAPPTQGEQPEVE